MYKDSKLETLSTGNQQRVQLTSALAFNPNALILDEPFSGLDPIAVDTMGNTLRRQSENGIPVLFSSHQLELIDEFCDRVIIIKQGKIVTQGTPDELRKEAGAPPTIEIPTPLAYIFKDLLRDKVSTSGEGADKLKRKTHEPPQPEPAKHDIGIAPTEVSIQLGGKNE
jgi:ABC-type multidrug transport system ATPase subunit